MGYLGDIVGVYLIGHVVQSASVCVDLDIVLDLAVVHSNIIFISISILFIFLY